MIIFALLLSFEIWSANYIHTQVTMVAKKISENNFYISGNNPAKFYALVQKCTFSLLFGPYASSKLNLLNFTVTSPFNREKNILALVCILL